MTWFPASSIILVGNFYAPNTKDADEIQLFQIFILAINLTQYVWINPTSNKPLLLKDGHTDERTSQIFNGPWEIFGDGPLKN